jgi:biopolymer transport protein ExbD
MASVSTGDEGDNPIAINVTPLVDVIFCLCVFFMISFRFKQIEGRFDAWLPRTTGLGPVPHLDIDPIVELRVALFWNETTRHAVRKLGSRLVATDEELERLLQGARDDCVRLGKPIVPLTIDADGRVPWSDVVDVVNLGKKSGIDRIEFAFPSPAAKR